MVPSCLDIFWQLATKIFQNRLSSLYTLPLRGQEERANIFVMKYWNKRPASVVTAPSVNIFKKRLENV